MARTYDEGSDFAPALGNSAPDALPPPTSEVKPNPAAGDLSTGDTDQPPTNTETTPNTTDWSSILGIYGMPPDVAAKVGQIFSDNPDVNTATALALAYIRGTDWYKATYPGIQAGMANGLTRNEADYRAYVNAINQYYKQYMGRAPTADEIASYLQNGTDASIVGKTLEGNSYAQTYKGDIELYAGNFGSGTLSQEELNSYGQEKVGLGSQQGYNLQRMIDTAIKRYQGAFGGQVATPQASLGPAGLAQQGLAGQKESLSNTPDVGA